MKHVFKRKQDAFKNCFYSTVLHFSKCKEPKALTQHQHTLDAHKYFCLHTVIDCMCIYRKERLYTPYLLPNLRTWPTAHPKREIRSTTVTTTVRDICSASRKSNTLGKVISSDKPSKYKSLSRSSAVFFP